MGNQVIRSEVTSRDYEFLRMSSSGDFLNANLIDVSSLKSNVYCEYCGEYHEKDKCRYNNRRSKPKEESKHEDQWNFEQLSALDGVAEEKYIRDLSIDICTAKLLKRISSDCESSAYSNILSQSQESLESIRKKYLIHHADV